MGPRKIPGFVGQPDADWYRHTWDDLADDPSWDEPLDAPGRTAAHGEFARGMTMLLGNAASSRSELRSFRDYYINCIREVDAAVGVVLDALTASGQADDTVVVYTSDHGELTGAHGLFGKGPCAYDANIRLPLIIVDPEVDGGGRSPANGVHHPQVWGRPARTWRTSSMSRPVPGERRRCSSVTASCSSMATG
jgi:arylsulfatase A-like enzyme